MRRARSLATLALVAAPLAFACNSAPRPTASSSSAPPPPVRTAPSASASASSVAVASKATEYAENDFVESDRNRDPFRSFLAQNQSTSKPTVNQRKVELAQYSLDELKLVAIVQGSDRARAMFIDPSGKGTVVYKGTFVGRPEVVHVGGNNGPEYQLNWRVDRIRDADVVLIREDLAQPAIPPATRVVPLHPEADKDPSSLSPG